MPFSLLICKQQPSHIFRADGPKLVQSTLCVTCSPVVKDPLELSMTLESMSSKSLLLLTLSYMNHDVLYSIPAEFFP